MVSTLPKLSIFVLMIVIKRIHSQPEFTDTIELPCTDPTDPINGRVAAYGGNLLVEYFCDDGFYMLGESFGACILTEGRWTIEKPWCLAYDCPVPEAPARGFVEMERNNSIAKFYCMRGHYLMSTTDTLYCLGNRWSGYIPLCVAASVGRSSRGQIDMRNDTEPLLNFDDALRSSDDTCSRYRVISPPEIDNGYARNNYLFNEARRLWSLIANYTCDVGFELVNDDNRYMFCRSYRWWAPVQPKCKKAVKIFYPCEKSRCAQVCIPGYGRHYACGCNRGYRLASDGWACNDINECKKNNGGCDHICYNRLGTRMCACKEGYLKVGDHCIDMDECTTGKTDCPGQCINTIGSYTCNCTGVLGYLPGVNRPCNDLDECQIDNGGCEHTCINTVASYRCRCKKKGYYLADDKHSCADRDECKKYGKKICHNGSCVNTPGTFHCDCKQGYRFHRPSKQCVDEDECKKDNGGCADLCINTIGSFMCECSHPGLQNSNNTCVDINECETNNGGCEDICINTEGSFYCLCREYGFVVHENGLNCTTCKSSEFIYDQKKMCIPCPPHSHTTNYTASSPMDCQCNPGYKSSGVRGVFCVDIDECMSGELECDYGCINTPGSAHCRCPEGYVNHNSTTCVDLNECEVDKTVCDGLCLNFEGSFRCDCEDGFYLANDSVTCVDIDECMDGTDCSHICNNTVGGFICKCHPGYELDTDNRTCIDINECHTLEGMKCGDECINLEGSFECVCKGIGLKLSWDKFSCSDINECQEGVNHCEDRCVNTFGSYRCECSQSGYALADDEVSCVDKDECLSPLTNECHQVCNNLPGTYNCSCWPGNVQISATRCDECPIGFYHNASDDSCIKCPLWSTTTSTAQSSLADCECIEGYHGNVSADIPCRDSNECEDDNFGCEQLCMNTEGSAFCDCNHGYHLDDNKKNCTDIDECKYHNHFCSDICENSQGSYTCSCRNGFQLYKDGKNCIDIDECSTLNPCNQRCENTWGSYICGCTTRGYVLDQDGHTCRENRPQLFCPENVAVDLPPGALNEVHIELSADLFTDDFIISPKWVSRSSRFPIGVTIVTVSMADSPKTVICSFTVSVQRD